MKQSKCRQDFLQRVVENEKKKKDAKAAGSEFRRVRCVLNRVSCVGFWLACSEPAPKVKRVPAQPKPGRTISGGKVTTLQPLPFKQLYT